MKKKTSTKKAPQSNAGQSWREKWLSDAEDHALVRMAPCADGVRWEYLRFLYFTDQLSSFWKSWAEAEPETNPTTTTGKSALSLMAALYSNPCARQMAKSSFPERNWNEKQLVEASKLPDTPHKPAVQWLNAGTVNMKSLAEWVKKYPTSAEVPFLPGQIELPTLDESSSSQ